MGLSNEISSQDAGAIEVLRSRIDHSDEMGNRALEHLAARLQTKDAQLSVALSSLSYTELKALKLVFAELEGLEGEVVTSRIADENKITRSVVVSALRKLSAANLLYSQSLGMRGTFIRISSERVKREILNH